MNILHTVLFVVCVAFAIVVCCVLLHRTQGHIDKMHVVYIILFGVLFGSLLCAYLGENSPEPFLTYQENMFPHCDWVQYIKKNTNPTYFYVRKSQQPTVASNVILVQRPNGPQIDMPTTMSSTSSLSYVLRVWVTSASVNALVQNNPFALVYLTATDNQKQSLPIQFQVVFQQNEPYEALPGTQWFLLESSVVNIPAFATFVNWRLEPTQMEVHWADFQIQFKRSAQNFEPSIGLQSLYSTFLPGHQIHQQLWKDESGYNANTYFEQLPISRDNGVIVPSVWNGPLSSVLIGNANTIQSTSNNIRDFTINFYYKPARLEVFTSVAPDVTLFTIYATYRNYYQYDNPPNYFLRCTMDYTNNQLCITQQAINEIDGIFTRKKLCVPLRNEINEPVLYSIVVTASTRTSGDVCVYANTQLETQQMSWVDLNYDLNSNANNRIIWGQYNNNSTNSIPNATEIETTMLTTTKSQLPSMTNSGGVLYMLSAYNKALSENEVIVLSRYISRSYNVGTTLQMPPSPKYYTPLSVANLELNPNTPPSLNKWGEDYILNDNTSNNTITQSLTEHPPPGQTACVKYNTPSLSEGGNVNDVSCSYVDTNNVNTLCPNDHQTEGNDLLFPYPNHTCDNAIAYVRQTTQNAHKMGMQWDVNDNTINGFVYRSKLNNDAYNNMTPDEKMNVLDDVPFNRNYRVLDDENNS